MHLRQKVGQHVLGLSLFMLASASHAKDVTVKIESPAFLNATLVFPVDGNELNAMSKTFSAQGPQFDKACAFYGSIGTDGRLNTQVKLDMTGFNLPDGRTLLVATVNAAKAGPATPHLVPGRNGKLNTTVNCPSTRSLFFTARVIVNPGQTSDLYRDAAASDTEFALTAIAP